MVRFTHPTANRQTASRRGLTKAEVLAVIAVVGVLFAISIPAIEISRERARRTFCINNLKQIGLAFHNFHDAQKMFPKNGEVVGGTATTPGTVTG
jgi:Tfp pilus assembly protein PilE